MANFAKWLPAFGWSPSVLTIRDENIEHVDPERRRDVEGIATHKVGVPRSVLEWYAAVKARVRGPAKDAPVPGGTGSGSVPGARGPAIRESRGRTLRRYVMSFLALPDFERAWIIPAARAAVRLLRQERIGWIMTSCPPYSVHLAGLAVRMLTGAKWIADFRDPWMTTGWKRMYPTCALSIRIESWLERKVVEKADLLVFNVERLRNAYRERYAHVAASKFVFIPNGIAPRLLVDGAPVAKFERFTLSYTGSLYVGRSPEPILQAVSQLIAEGQTAPDAVRILLVGHCRTVNGVPTDELVRRYGLELCVEVRDPVPYSEALDIVRRSQLALLFAPNLPFSIPAKVYDYLGAGTRILAIAEEGGTSDLIAGTGAGRTFVPEDVEGIKRFIHQEMTSPLSAGANRATDLARFEVRRITEDLASHLDRIAKSEAAGAQAADAPQS